MDFASFLVQTLQLDRLAIHLALGRTVQLCFSDKQPSSLRLRLMTDSVLKSWSFRPSARKMTTLAHTKQHCRIIENEWQEYGGVA